MVVAGLAVTLPPVAADNPVAGLQLKVFAPDAVRVVLPPAHIAAVPVTVTVGTAFTATVTVEESIQPAALVPFTV